MTTINFTTLHLSQVLGLYLLILGISMLIHRAYYQTAAVTIIQNAALNLITGLLVLICGTLMVVFHNIWVMEWPVVITLLAWTAFLKGIFRLLFPKKLIKWQIQLVHNNRFYYSCFVVVVILGAFLSYMGFMVSQPLIIDIRV